MHAQTLCKISMCFGLDQRSLSFKTKVIISGRCYVFLISVLQYFCRMKNIREKTKKRVYPKEYLQCDGHHSGLWTQHSAPTAVWICWCLGHFYSPWGKGKIQVISPRYEAFSEWRTLEVRTCMLQKWAWWNILTCGWRDWVPPQKSCALSLWQPTSSFCRSSGKSACSVQHSRSLGKGAKIEEQGFQVCA